MTHTQTQPTTTATAATSPNTIQHNLSAYQRYADECAQNGMTAMPIGQWYSLPSVGSATDRRERQIREENANAPLTAETTVTVAPVRHAARSVRALRTLSEIRAERATKAALRRERLRSAVDRVASAAAMTESPSANRPTERDAAADERAKWLERTMPQILDALGLEGAEGVRLAKAVGEAWLDRREAEAEKGVSKRHQDNIWRSMPSSQWKGMALGQTPADTVRNGRNNLRYTSHRGFDCGSGLYSSIIPVTAAELADLKARYRMAMDRQRERAEAMGDDVN